MPRRKFLSLIMIAYHSPLSEPILKYNIREVLDDKGQKYVPKLNMYIRNEFVMGILSNWHLL